MQGVDACSTESALRQLARHLAETIERDSRALVQEVCVHMLGAQRVPGEPEEAPARQLSSSCSDEVCCSPCGLLHDAGVCGPCMSLFLGCAVPCIQLAC
jgi:hypothetical protein